MRAASRVGTITIAIVVGLILVAATCGSTYNKLVRLDQTADAQWAQVENAYQRRADLIPNLVATVKGAASFEKDTITKVTEARARVGQVQGTNPHPTENPEAFHDYQAAQDQLGGALSRLLVVAEAYPELKATQNFRDLQSQIEGSENRIAVERMRYNDAAREFDSVRASFPTVVIAGLFGDRFAPKQYFRSSPGAAKPPEVRF